MKRAIHLENISMKYKVYNVDPGIHPADDVIHAIMAKADAQIFERDCITERDVIEFAANADALIAARAPITSEVVKNLTNCKVIARPGAGTDNIDHEQATKQGIVVVYVPDFCTEEVANHALTLILACYKKLGVLDKFVRNGNWGFDLLPPMPALKGQVLGLVGFGRISQCLARKAKSLGLKVLVYDPYVPKDIFDKNNLEPSDFESILKKSDFISLHIPLTEETRGMISENQFSMMKPTAYIINCARGAVIDEQSLVKALQQKKLAGAALDCLTKEPPDQNNPLFAMDNVIFTPHSAAYSDDAIDYLRRKTAQQVAQVLKGQQPEFIRNPEVLRNVKLMEINKETCETGSDK
jgi:D-3-phosphoglycerate dehydrogenase / 2-oxoglutarate reductase